MNFISYDCDLWVHAYYHIIVWLNTYMNTL